MNPREISKKKYEDALKAYQEQIVQIAILEYELRDLGKRKPNTKKEDFDNLKARIGREYEELSVLAQAVTDTFNEYDNFEEPTAEKVNLNSLEKEKFTDEYYEILDRYEDQLEHVRLLEAELTELGERRPKASTAEIMAKRAEIDAAYDALAEYATALSETVGEKHEERTEEISLEELKEEIDAAIDQVRDEELTKEDKQIISELEVEEIARLRKELQTLQRDLKANIQRKGELIRKNNAKEENLRGFDEAIRQLETRIKDTKDELNYYLNKHPELKTEKKEANKKGLGFDELSRYIEGYLYMKSDGREKVHTEVNDSYSDQRDISITLSLGSGYTYHYNDARNPQTGESYGYICWIAHRKDGKNIAPTEFSKPADEWANECDHVFQFRGNRKVGIQVQELVMQEDGNLHPLYVYETRGNTIVKGIVGENELREVSVAEMLTDIDGKLNVSIQDTKDILEIDEFEYDRLEIERLEKANEELTLHRNENEKRKLLLLERDNAQPENLRGYDEAIRQINQEIKINEEIIASLKTKYPEVYKEVEETHVTEETERPTKEEIEDAIEEALANVEASKKEYNEHTITPEEVAETVEEQMNEVVVENTVAPEMTEEQIENEIIGILSREEIADIIDRKLNEIYAEDNKKDKELINNTEIEDVIAKEMEKVPETNTDEFEEIFEGTFINNGNLTEEESRRKIFELMERAGVKLNEKNKSELDIIYHSAEGNNVKFSVRRPIKKVPYQEPTVEDYPKNEAVRKAKKIEEITQELKDDTKEYIQTMTPNGIQLVEKITLYVDLDNSEVYGKKYLFKRFNMDKLSEKVIIDGFSCYKMANDYVEYIVRNQNNNYSPYVVETREVHMGKKEKPEEKVDEKTQELANEISIAEYYMHILHPEYKDINKLDKDTQRALFIDYWYIRDNYKDLDSLFRKMKNYYSGADIDDKSLLISILPKYVVEQEIARRTERNEEYISEKEYKEAIYKALANKDRYMPEWSYTETMLSEITNVNTKNIILSQNDIEINKEFKVEKPEIQKPKQDKVQLYTNEITPLEELRNVINNVLVNYLRNIYSVDEAIAELARIFQQNTNAINYSLENVENKDKIREALMHIINNRNSLYEMCGILVGELTDNSQIQYVNLEDAFKITDLEGEVYNDVVTYLMSTLLIQQTESQIIVDNKVVEQVDSNTKRR